MSPNLVRCRLVRGPVSASPAADRSENRLRIVLTGGAGFIGAHVAAALLAHDPALDLAIIDDLSTGNRARLGALPVAFHRRDVRERLDDLLADTPVVVHLAASAGVPPSVADPLADAQANIAGTVALLESCRRAGVRRVVYASSAAVYGRPAQVPIHEDAPTHPLSPYGLSKLTGERYVLLYGDLFGLDTCALRFFNVYGPGQRPDSGYSGVITLFTDRLRQRRPLHIEGDGQQTKDFIHVHDVARAVVIATQASGANGTYNIASGAPTGILSLAETMIRVSGRAVPIEYHPPRPGDVRQSVAAVQRAARGLGFRAQVGLEAGLHDLWQQAKTVGDTSVTAASEDQSR